MEMVPAQTPLFQPTVSKVSLYHHGIKIALECREGVTFGTITEQLKKMEDEQYFRQRNKSINEDMGRLPYTHASCKAYASALKLLNGTCDQNCCTSLNAPYLCPEAEGAIPNDSEAMEEARSQFNRAIGHKEVGRWAFTSHILVCLQDWHHNHYITSRTFLPT